MIGGKAIKGILFAGSALIFGINQILEWAKEKQDEERFNERFDERFDSKIAEIQEANFEEIEEETEETT